MGKRNGKKAGPTFDKHVGTAVLSTTTVLLRLVRVLFFVLAARNL